MAKKKWLTLTEYSNKYEVSVSTLRRRIKNDQVEFEYSNGKYFLKDVPLSNHSAQSTSSRVTIAPPQKNNDGHSIPRVESQPKPETEAIEKQNPEAVFETANRLLDEIKKAYSMILSEKEEQIIHLKDEVADLKTLVRVLESENERLKSTIGEAAPIDPWLRSMDD